MVVICPFNFAKRLNSPKSERFARLSSSEYVLDHSYLSPHSASYFLRCAWKYLLNDWVPSGLRGWILFSLVSSYVERIAQALNFYVESWLCVTWLEWSLFNRLRLVNFNWWLRDHDCWVLVSVNIGLVPSDCSALLQVCFDPRTKHQALSLFLQKLARPCQLHVSKLVYSDCFWDRNIVCVNHFKTFADQIMDSNVRRRIFVVNSIQNSDVYCFLLSRWLPWAWATCRAFFLSAVWECYFLLRSSLLAFSP